MFPLRVVAGNDVAAHRNPALLSSDVQADWDVAVQSEFNLLVEGAPSRVDGILAALKPHLREPVCEFTPADGACMPQPHEGTLILLEVARLSAAQQTMLCQWLDESDGHVPVRVVSTSSEPLFSNVRSGAFPSELYYRLNIVRITPPGSDERTP